MEKKNKYYIYFHINPLKNEIFYVGKGFGRRAYLNGIQRNKFWHNIVKKYGYIIDIIHTNLSEKEAFKLELYYIKKIGRRDLNIGTLVNLTDGGEGSSGRKQSKKMKKKLSISRLGSGNPFFNKKHSEATIKILKIQKTGNKNPFFGKHHTIKSIKKVSSSVVAINKDGTEIGKFISIMEASKFFKIPRVTIRFSIKNNSINKKTGLIFRLI